jgi:hypothetical protein
LRRHQDQHDAVLAVLVRSWIAADPLSGSDRAPLYRQLKGGLEELRRHLADPDGALETELERYDGLAHWWARPGQPVPIPALV